MKRSEREFLIRWIEALRSEDYKQGDEYLFNKDTDGYCCLGVAADLLGIPTEAIEGEGYLVDQIVSEYHPSSYICDRTWEVVFASLNDGTAIEKIGDNYFPYDFCKKHKLGVEVDRGIVLKRHSFEEIADIIEKYILNKLPDKN